MKKKDFKQNPETNFKDLDALNISQARREAEALRAGISYHDS